MPTLSDTTKVPGAVDPATVTTTVELWGDGAPVTGRPPGSDPTIGGKRVVTGNPFTVTGLVGNADLVPAGTVYRVQRKWPGLRVPLVDYIDMPSTGGPYKVGAIEVDEPATIASAALSAHEIDTDLHGGGRLLSIVSKTDGNFVTSLFQTPITGMDLPVTIPAKSDGTIRPFVLRFMADVIAAGPSPAQIFASVQPRVGGVQIATEWRTEGHSSSDGAAQRLTAFFEVDIPNALHNPAPGSIVTYQPYAAVYPPTATLTVIATQAFGIPVPATFKAVTQ